VPTRLPGAALVDSILPHEDLSTAGALAREIRADSEEQALINVPSPQRVACSRLVAVSLRHVEVAPPGMVDDQDEVLTASRTTARDGPRERQHASATRAQKPSSSARNLTIFSEIRLLH
jgi:hypothetical protein